ncbi:unnamed protein product [Sphagnum balticum]
MTAMINARNDVHTMTTTAGIIGIGPTHDDRTFAGVAAAFEDSLLVNVELEKVVREYFAERMNSAQDTQPYLKLCTVGKHSLIPFDTDPLHDCVTKFDAYLNTLRSEPSSERYLSNVESAVKLINDILSEYDYTGPIRPALERVCAEQPSLKVVFMGGRRGDPGMLHHSKLIKPPITPRSRKHANTPTDRRRLAANVARESVARIRLCTCVATIATIVFAVLFGGKVLAQPVYIQ